MNINKFFTKFNSCPICNSKKRSIARYSHKHRYAEQISRILNIDLNTLIKKIRNVKCNNCGLIYKSLWFKKKLYKSLFNKYVPVHPKGWDSGNRLNRFSKKNLKKAINLLINSIKSNNLENRGFAKRDAFSIVDSIQANSNLEKKLKKNYLVAIINENISHIEKNQFKMVHSLNIPERFKRFSNFSDEKLFYHIQKYIGKIKYYGEVGCPLWGMLQIAKNNGSKTIFISGDESIFWGKKCQVKKKYCCSEIDKSTKFIKKGINSCKGKKLDFLGIFVYLDHTTQPLKLLKKAFSVANNVGIILAETKNPGFPGVSIQHFSGWNNKTMSYVAKKFNKKLNYNFKDIKVSGYNFFLLYQPPPDVDVHL